MHEHRLLQSLPHCPVITYCLSPGGKHSAARGLFSTMSHLLLCLLGRSPTRLPMCFAKGGCCLLSLWPPHGFTWSRQCCCFPELTTSAYSLTRAHIPKCCMATLPSERKAAISSHLPGISSPGIINLHQRALLLKQGLSKKLKAGIQSAFGIAFC